jgi:predicted Zn-ribbon and HTH transcriptional regulator
MLVNIGLERLSKEQLAQVKEVVNQPQNPVKYISIDPGKTNGVCGYDEKYYCQFMVTIPSIDMMQFLNQFDKVDKCICESYKVYPQKAKQHIYSDMETSRVIGRIESWAELKGIELIMQPASIKPTGYAWTGKKPLPKSNSLNHQLDAYIHFMYWAVRNGKINAGDLLKTNNV